MADADRRLGGGDDGIIDLDPINDMAEIDEEDGFHDLTPAQQEAADALAARQQADEEAMTDEEIRRMLE